VFKGLVLKMILSPLEAITSPNTFKIYKVNFKSIKNIENKKSLNLTPKKN
jgi:hypothetical protein